MADPILDSSVIESPGWWLAKLSRRLDDRRVEMTRYADYYAGTHRLMFATQKFREAFGGLFSEVADNFCEVVVDKLVERLEVEGFRFKAPQVSPQRRFSFPTLLRPRTVETGETANGRAWEVWQANDLDADFAKGIREGFIKGEFSMTVWSGGPNGLPRLTVEDPLNVVVALDPGDTRIRRAALKRWYDPDYGRTYATLYLPDATYKFQTGQMSTLLWANQYGRTYRQITTWERRIVENEPWPLPNPLGVVPVIPFPNKPDLAGVGVSELKNVVPVQDAINKLVSDMLLASEFGAFPQRYATNVVLEVDPDTQLPKEPWKIDVARMITAPPPLDPTGPETKFGQFDAAELAQYTNVIELMLKHLAVQTRMPPHYLLGNTGVWPSGESLRSAETGLVRKATDRQRDLSEPLENVLRLTFAVMGDDSIANAETETLWANPETQTESAHVDALVKLGTLGVPKKGLWEKIPASPTEIQHWEKLLADGDTPPAPNPPPGEPELIIPGDEEAA